MSKPIDQEREAFEAWFAREIEPSVSYGNPDILRRSYWTAWQARAAVQPAGGAVPDCLAAELHEIAGRILEMAHAKVKPVSHTLMAPTRDYTLADAQKIALFNGERLANIADSLATAAHPVSGEQKSDTSELLRLSEIAITRLRESGSSALSLLLDAEVSKHRAQQREQPS